MFRLTGISAAVLVLAMAAPFGGDRLLAQEFGRPVGRRYPAVGTYRGTRSGSQRQVLYNGDIVTERTECSLTMTFHENGSMTYDAGRYFYEKVYDKKTANGYLRATTTIQSDPDRNTIRSGLEMVVTQYEKVWQATWQPYVETMGWQVLQVEMTDARGRVIRRDPPASERKLVRCDVHVLWRGRSQREEGLPLSGQQTRNDEIARLPWITVHAEWNLRPIRPNTSR